MMIEQTDHGFLGINIHVAPDDEYEYLYCVNKEDKGQMYLRRDGDFMNLWDVNLGDWHPRSLSWKKMTNKHLLQIIIVTSPMSFLLPTWSQTAAQSKKDNN